MNNVEVEVKCHFDCGPSPHNINKKWVNFELCIAQEDVQLAKVWLDYPDPPLPLEVWEGFQRTMTQRSGDQIMNFSQWGNGTVEVAYWHSNDLVSICVEKSGEGCGGLIFIRLSAPCFHRAFGQMLAAARQCFSPADEITPS